MYIYSHLDNLTTAFLVVASAAGIVVTKKLQLSHHIFAVALGSTFALDFMQRRELGATSPYSVRSS